MVRLRHDGISCFYATNRVDAFVYMSNGGLKNLLELTDSETAFIDAFIAKEYRPELLFDDAEIIKNVRNHPMAYWKIK